VPPRRKRDKLAASSPGSPTAISLKSAEDRRHDRIVPRNPIALLTLRGRQQDDLPDHRPVEFRCCDRRRKPPAAEIPGHAGQGAVPGGANLEEGFALDFVHEQNHETLEDAVSAPVKRRPPKTPDFEASKGGVRNSDAAFSLSGARRRRLTPGTFAATCSDAAAPGALMRKI